jgi:Cu/Ag efflux protein CusF
VIHLPGRDLILRGSAQVDGSGAGADNGTGRVTADFDNIPDLGFSNMTLAFNSGNRALLTNPAACGTQTVSADLTPNSTGGVVATRTATFITSHDGIGAACPASDPFAPTFTGSVSTTQAGGHPDLTMTVNRTDKNQQLRNMNLHLPTGLVANTSATPQCTQANAAIGNCAAATRIGSVTTAVGSGAETYSLSGGIHNTVPSAGEPARLTAIVPVVVGPFDLGKLSLPVSTALRGDFGIDASTQLPLRFEGVPVRVRSLQMVLNGIVGGNSFMTNPSTCQSNSIVADMVSPTPSTVTGVFSYTTTGCPITFNPSISASVSSSETAKPTGLTFGISVPADHSTLKSVQMTLPPGMDINPAAGNGPLAACSTAAIDAGGATCPATSNQGTVTLNTPLLPAAQTGNVYLETPGATPAMRYKLAIVIHLPGRDLVLHGNVQVNGSGGGADSGTGRVTADFGGIPDLGFSNMTLAFNTGNRSLLTNPATCGAQTVSADLTPNTTGGPVATRTASFTTSYNGVGGACPATDPFAPTFTGSVSTTQAGGHPDLTLSVTRPDKHQALRNVNFHLPAGLVATSPAVPRCTQAAAATATCAPASQVGTLNTSVGSGAETLALNGAIYNTEPDPTEPARLTAVVPVVVGPFDLGTMSIPVTTSLRADYGVDTATQLPLRYEGVPVRIRSMSMVIDGIVGGSEFMTNPSTCQINVLSADMVAPSSTTATSSFSYATTGCPTAFNPSITATVSSGETEKPAGLTLGINVPDGNSTLKRTQITLPAGMEINPAVGNGPLTACSTAAIDAGGATCPATSNQGAVTLNTPLLGAPATGNVYLETPGATPATRYKLAIVVHLPGRDLIVHGSAQVDGSGSIDSGTGRVTADFDNIPDLAFSSLSIAFNTGDRALLTNPASCGTQTVSANLTPNTTGGPVATRTAGFTTSYDGAGGACPASESFTPAFSGAVSTTAAGGHPDLTLTVTRPNKHKSLRNLNLHLPVGLVATSTAVPQCSQASASAGTCTAASRVGTVSTSVGSGAETLNLTGWIHNTVPSATEPARLTAIIPIVVGPFDLGMMSVPVTTSLRSDYGVDTATQLPLRYEGVPVRIRSMSLAIDGIVAGNDFMTNPSNCQSNTLAADMVAPDTTTVTGSFSYSTTGCPTAFDPSISASVSDTETAKPTGLTFGIGVPNGHSTLQRVQMTLPAGMEINPAVGNGPLTACSTAAIDAGGATCPATSSQGTVTLITPLLGSPATGNLYLETPGATPSTRYKLAIVVHLPGHDLVIHGSAQVDGSGTGTDTGSGRVTADFGGIPDLAFSTMTVAFNTGDRALLTNPVSCGSQTVSADLTPNTTGGAVVTRTANFMTSYDGAGAGCPANDPFAPTFSGSVSTTAAGAHPDLTLTVDRSDKNQQLRNFNVHLPVGLVANTSAVPRCSQANAAAGNCLAANAVGSVTTGVGSGDQTYTLGGTIYNTTPNASEPARLTAVVPVVVGPYDLGKLSLPVTTSLRGDLGVDASTQLPLRFEGVPVRIQSMQMVLNGNVGGNDFMTNPSKCQSNVVTADMISPAAQSVSGSFSYATTACPTSFNPSISASVSSTETAKPTGLTFGVTIPADDSTLGRLQLTLPAGMEINPAAGNGPLTACSTAAIDAGGATCPATSNQGTVTMATPLLGSAVTGNVYLETPGATPATRYKLAIVLHLPGRDLVIRGAVQVDGSGAGADSGTGRVTADFNNIPDLAFTAMDVAFNTGNRALLSNPIACGAHTVSADLTPNSTGGSVATRTANITTSFDGTGGACPANEPFTPNFSGSVSTTQAGGHPDLTLTVTRPNKTEQLRNFNLHLPSGLVATSTAVTRCSQASAAAGTCAAASRVGTVTTSVGSGAETLSLSGAIHNTEPDASEPARLTAIVSVVVGPFDLGTMSLPVTTSLRGDYGVDTATELPLRYEGVPVRIRSISMVIDGVVGGNDFMTNPSNCQPHTLTADMVAPDSTTVTGSFSYTTSGCPTAFDPSISAAVSTTETAKPTGLTFGISVPSGNSTVKRVQMTLPAGMEINPAAGNGPLTACSTAAIDAGGATCPATSNQGTVTLNTPLLGAPATGNVYLETPGATPSTRYKLGVVIHLPGQELILHGSVQVDGSGSGADAGTGRVTADFDNIPDLSFSSLSIAFNTGNRALLTNPVGCGAQAVSADLTPHTTGGSVATRTATFTTSHDGAGAACPASAPFAPTFTGSVSTTQAGGHPDLTLTVNRTDKNQQLRNFNVHLPVGLVATSPAVPQCAQSDATAGNCAVATEVGTVTTSVGSGSETYALSGTIHNTVPGASEPARLTATIPVVVGPFDLGKLSLPVTTGLRAGDYGVDASTQLPLRFEGVPVRIRDMSMTIDGVVGGANFMTNPSKCQVNTVSADMVSPSSSTATGSFNYTTTACPTTFNPSITASVSSTETATPTGLTFGIGLPAGDSTLKRVQMTLPAGMEINPAAGNGPLAACTTAAINAGGAACPPSSNQGTVTMVTPLLGGPQTGNVYLETPGATPSTRYKLAIVVHLPGSELVIRGAVQVDGSGAGADSGTGRVTADFDDVPDLGFSSLTVAFNTGHRALLTNPAVCGLQTVSADLTPHSTGGAVATRTDSFTTSYDGAGAACPGSEPFAPTFSGAVSTTQAGGHPDLLFTVNRGDKTQQLRNFNIHLPVGLVASTSAADQCTQANAASGNCAADTRVGSVTTSVGTGGETYALAGTIHNTVPGASEPARLTAVVPVVVGPFNFGKLSLPITTSLRGDLGVDTATQLPLRFEGIPVRVRDMSIQIDGIGPQGPFTVNPSKCQLNTVTADMAAPGGATATGSFSFTTTGCPASFNPALSVSVDTTETAKPVGLTIGIGVPYGDSSLKHVQMSLPAGMELNPAIGNGPLQACDLATIDAGGSGCPATSNLGTVTLNTPLLPAPQTGNIYLETPGATPATRYKMAIVIHLPGQDLVVHGSAQVNGSGGGSDSGTGQVTAEFDNLPDIQFTNLQVSFKTGSRALLTNPVTCGAHTMGAGLTPHTTGGPTANRTASFSTSYNGSGAACPGADPQNPSFTASLSTYQAGDHPDVTIDIVRPDKDQNIRKLKVMLPNGLVGDADAAPTCSQTDADAGSCATNSQVGTIGIDVGSGSETYHLDGTINNTVAASNRPAKLTATIPVNVGPFDFGKVVVPIDVNLNPDDYSLEATTGDMPTRFEGIPVRIRAMHMVLAGVVDPDGPGGAAANAFMSNPRTCSALNVRADITSPLGSTVRKTAPLPLPITGCESLALAGSIDITNSTSTAWTPTALGVQLNLPPAANQATLRKLVLALPGFRLNAPGANGLTACTATQLTAQICPANSQVGTAWLDTSLLPIDGGTGHSLTGKVYLETPGNSAADRYKLAVQLSGKTTITLRGTAVVDETTGEMTTVFDNLPDIPFDAFRVDLTGAANPILLNPQSCGISAAAATLTPWSASSSTDDVTLAKNLTINGCTTHGFAPTNSVTLSTSNAGAHPDAQFVIDRPDGDQDLKSVSVSLPPGFLGSAAAVPQCAVAAAQAAGCSAASKVGSIEAKVGTGTNVLTLPGDVYLTAGQGGDIAGMAMRIPAIAGPYNLGDVVALGRINLRPSDHGLDVTFDDIPRIFKGVPTQLQRLKLNLAGTASSGKPFLYNASNCAAAQINTTFGSYDGGSATSGSPYQPTACGSRPFNPKLEIVGTGGNTTIAPAWLMKMTMPDGNATLRRANVLLPTVMTVNILGLNGLCEVAQADAWACPEHSRIGTAAITTPLLPGPVNGSVYVARGTSTLPDLMIMIGAPFNIQIRGANRFINNIQIQSTFDNLPDLIWSEMSMNITGGAKGLIGLRAGGACGDAKTTFGGHGGEGIDKMGPVTGISACSNALNVCDKPSVIVATRGAKKAKFKNSQMSVMFSSAAHCSAVKSFTMLLPKGTKIDKRMLKKGKNITGRAGSDRLKGKAFAMSGKTGLKIKSKLPADTHGVTLKTVKSLVKLPYKSFCGNIKGKSRTAKAKMNKCKKKTVSFTFVVTRADGSVLKFVHKVKAGDRRFK